MNRLNNKRQRQQQGLYPFERFASVTSYTGFDFLTEDPSWIIYIADTNGQFNLWRQRSTLGSESEPYSSYRLTNFIDEAVRHVFPSPVDNSISFLCRPSGSRKLPDLQD